MHRGSGQTLLPLIHKKKQGEALSEQEIGFFIETVTEGTVPDYQIASLLMAIFLKNLTKKEIYFLTKAMLHSGQVFPSFNRHTIDKHSTGGIGDKSSLVLAPLAAACGITVPMIAGRGLGHTGGTIDKLEAIPGFRTALSSEEFIHQLQNYGMVLMGQTESIAPADKKLYALRDVTGTVDNIALITASILSKKLAEGAAGLVLDIKCGSAAFMQSPTAARQLAKSLRSTGEDFGKKVTCLITDMDQPTGEMIGNALEVLECIDILRGAGPQDLRELCLELGSEMVLLGKRAKTYKEARLKVETQLDNGQALQKFDEFVSLQGGPKNFAAQASSLLEVASQKTVLTAPKSGYLWLQEAHKLGEALTKLGGGRLKKEDNIDHSVGLCVHKRMADKVEKGEPLITFYHHENQKELIKKIKADLLQEVVQIKVGRRPQAPKLILQKMR